MDGEQRLRDLVLSNDVRDADLVMSPASLGAARLTRYSFSRTMLRRAAAGEWTFERSHFDIDANGVGETVYRISTGNSEERAAQNSEERAAQNRTLSFVAFTTTMDESLHTDRVVAGQWEISAALVEGDLVADPELFDLLRSEVPKQERGRLPSSVLVLTRGNRSVRFFDYLVDTLASGNQPDADLVGDAGYIMRSTAFYGNGKFGMRSFEGLGSGGPVSAPYRAQMVAGWCYRELSYDVVEHCARERGGENAVGFDDEWSRFFGLGNATGLGLVPYAFKHPRVIDSWAGIREVALASARAAEATPERLTVVKRWLDRAIVHFSTGTDADCTPFLSSLDVSKVAVRLAAHLHEIEDDPTVPRAEVFDRWYRWAEADGVETGELCVSILLELGPTLESDLDDELDQLLVVDESVPIDPGMSAGVALQAMAARFGWIDELPEAVAAGDEFWWVMSNSNEEPRRVRRSDLDADSRDVSIDIVGRMLALRTDLEAVSADELLSTVVAGKPEHAMAVKRLIESDRPFGEPRDNPCSDQYLPLQLQRFQLAMYGMDNFKPKSTDWLRVTLFQGAPRHADLNAQGRDLADDWVLPRRPGTP